MSSTIEPVNERPGSVLRGHRPAIAIAPLGLSLSIFLTITFLGCAVANLIPGLNEIHILSALYPDIDWASPTVIATGAVMAFLIGWYVALLFGSLHNLFSRTPR